MLKVFFYGLEEFQQSFLGCWNSLNELLKYFERSDLDSADCTWVHDPSALKDCPQEKPIIFFCRNFHDGYSIPSPLIARIRSVPISLGIAISDSVRREWEKVISPIVTIPNGVDINTFTPQPQKQICDRKRQVAFVGRLDQDKGIDFLLENWAKEYPELVIAGRPFSNKWWGHQVKNFAAPNISFLGVLPRDEIVRIFQESILTILPSRREPFGRVLIESMACGTPAIGSRVGGIPEVIGSEFTFAPLDADKFHNVLSRSLAWPNLRPGQGNSVRERVLSHFEIRVVAQRVESAIRDRLKELR